MAVHVSVLASPSADYMARNEEETNAPSEPVSALTPNFGSANADIPRGIPPGSAMTECWSPIEPSATGCNGIVEPCSGCPVEEPRASTPPRRPRPVSEWLM
jgi:hypothetical protein